MIIAIVSEQISSTARSILKSYADKLIDVYSDCRLYDAVSSHPDMQLCPINEKCVVVDPEISKITIKELGDAGVNIIRGGSTLESKYPWDIPYNAGICGRYYFHNVKYTDSKLKNILDEAGQITVDVPQGYSKCSLVPLGEEGIITSDVPIFKKALEYGMKSMLVNPREVFLKGMNHGLIGGATGVLQSKKIVFFNGDPMHHSQGNEMIEFITDCGYDHVSLNNGCLNDIGSIFFLEL
ncbi:DUF6873 family GME fold protein [Alkalibacter mobilis]|uniref:DUF6873 family GME fold protein n=1 Tax=Alkalibacter mobilis TaxID=2787712 RepID=UPI00189E760E|nr:hypothetical protein [Alkalibacter mobilis]MBF7096528.1 hypothetical protein [Alkalibacter mobilis]